MGFPQPSSKAAVLAGQKYFRLNTPLVSPGDIYESEVSGGVFAIGPDSDIARVNVDYYDDSQSPTFLGQIGISNRAPFSGVISARPQDKYQPSGVPGRILFSPADIVPSLDPAGYYPNVLTIMIIQPVMDVIQYFSAPPSGILPARNDRNNFYSDIPAAPAFSLLIPYYGRAFGFIGIRDPGATGVTVAINGINYGVGVVGPNNVKVIRAVAPIGAGIDQIITSTTVGDFDYIQISYAAGSGVMNVPTRIIFSDVPR